MRIYCPSCETHFSITVTPEHKETLDPTSPLNARAMRAILEFMREVGPTRKTAGALYRLYKDEQIYMERDWPELSHNAFARALRRNGAQPWRTGTERGYVIPAIPADQKPAPIAVSRRPDYQRPVRVTPSNVVVPPGSARDARAESALQRIGREAREREAAELAEQRSQL